MVINIPDGWVWAEKGMKTRADNPCPKVGDYVYLNYSHTWPDHNAQGCVGKVTKEKASSSQGAFTADFRWPSDKPSTALGSYKVMYNDDWFYVEPVNQAHPGQSKKEGDMFYSHAVRRKGGWQAQVLMIGDPESGREPDSDKVVWESDGLYVDDPEGKDSDSRRFGAVKARQAAEEKIDTVVEGLFNATS